MRISARIILIAVTATASAFAQPREGKTKELSLSGSYQNRVSEGSPSSGAFLVSPRLGFFVFEGLELEPEVTLMFASGSEPVYLVNGNISYNFPPGGKTMPFLLAGYGIANTVPVFNIPFSRSTFSVGVLNLGAGVKAFLGEDVAIRFEYRFQHFRADGPSFNYGWGSYTQKVDTKLHTVQFGFSVLL